MNEPITTQPAGVSSKMTPKFFFLSVGVLISLITSVVAFLNLAFETLDFKFPDVLNATYQYGYNTFNYEGARMALATLIIFLPIFFVLMRYWKKTVSAGLGRVDEVIRKWMLYLLIFLAALVAAIDLVTLVKYFVGGEITTRFIIKVLVVLVVAKQVGLYHYYQLRDGRWKKLVDSVAPWFAIVLSLALVVWSFSVIGSPREQRLWRLDERRVQDLQSIQQQVINYWQQKEKLPANLTDLATPTSYFSVPVDPEFEKGKNYEYKSTGELSFELCAAFSADMPKGWVEYSNGGGVRPMYDMGSTVATDMSYPYPGGMNDSWDHKAGRTCFTRTIDKDFYPPYPDPVPLKQ